MTVKKLIAAFRKATTEDYEAYLEYCFGLGDKDESVKAKLGEILTLVKKIVP